MTDPVTSTYRLQLHAGFTFADAEQQVPYLARLGVSHLYLSPILQAVPGSMHGYDVVDHTRVNDELGGREGFESLVAAARAANLGIVVDVVPNHMAFVAPESLNHPVWEVLKDGRDASTAEWFDIDWKVGGGRINLPVLGSTLEEALAAGEITLDSSGEEPVVRYFDHVWPVALGTETDDVAELLQRQHYRLASWRDKDELLNYRRFFEVDGLIAIRVELPEVFDATHALLLDLHHAGLIDGFRIDHPDGLADPGGYLDRLSQQTRRGTPIWVEKILEGSEQLPEDWHCAGTTGYDALRVVQAALTDPTDASAVNESWAAVGGDPDFEHAVRSAKRQVVAQALAPEVDRLTRRAREALPEHDPERLREAIVELLVGGEVYRAYVRVESRLPEEARRRLREAFTTADAARPDLREELEALVPLTVLAEDDQAATDFGIRLQQTWGPVMAKGIEDTTFYRWHRLVALNEVGSDPTVLASASPRLLHEWAAHQQQEWPLGMTTLSTHDTKRSEDVRARLLALAADPHWWRTLAKIGHRFALDAGVDGPTGHLVWQTLFGAMPIDDERLEDYLVKALREGKEHTAWVDGDSDYEERVVNFAERLRDSQEFTDACGEAMSVLAEPIRATTLAAKLLQLTIPGVPDTYQGTEIVNLSLVDPDNRRPVDYPERARLLGEESADDQPPPGLDAEKLWVVHQALELRGRKPEAFGASSAYEPIDGGDHVVGFVRTHQTGLVSGLLNRGPRARIATLVTRAPGRLAASGGWSADDTVPVPEGLWRDVLTGNTYDSEGSLACEEVFASRPVALLEEIQR